MLPRHHQDAQTPLILIDQKMKENIKGRLSRLREELSKRNFDAWIAATGDPHMDEYTPDDWALRRYLSGFTGSAGTLVVTPTAAALWTDSRYWEQAMRELSGSGIVLMRDGEQDTPSIGKWLCAHVPESGTVGVDASTISSDTAAHWQNELAATSIGLADDFKIIDTVWENRPAASDSQVREFPYHQLPRADKLAEVRAAVTKEGAQALFLSTLDDIAWLTNLRGADIPCTPVFAAHMLVLPEKALLFINEKKMPAAIATDLLADGIEVHPYAEALDALTRAAEQYTVLVDEKRVCARFVQATRASGKLHTVNTLQPTTLIKSRKTPQELDALRETMVTDGVALCELFAWIEEQYLADKPFTEWDVSMKLLELRSRSPEFIEPSFTTIAAYGPNAAEPHYTPKEKKSSVIEPGSMLLIDSGGQYTGGTTDITRTIGIGEPTKEMKRDYTAVLQAHIALAMAQFPLGTYSSQLDTLARVPLWNIGANFGHGTGHGVGFCLGVHEGPCYISPRAPTEDFSRIVPGLVISNEPGLYRAGRWGIRTENLITPRLLEQAPQGLDTMGDFLKWETLTVCPIDTRLINIGMLSPVEIWWLNDYHLTVRGKLKGKLSPKAEAWMHRACELI